MTTNRSYDTEGLDNPTVQWTLRHVRAKAHPQWGVGRVMRWYPAHGGQPPRLRVMFEGMPAPQVIATTEVERLD